MTEHLNLELTVEYAARQRGIQSVQGLVVAAKISWSTADDLLKGTAIRVDRDVLARVCHALQCQPSHLLQLVPTGMKATPPILGPERQLQPRGRIVVKGRELAEAAGLMTVLALAEAAGIAWDTAADYWHGKVRRLDRGTLPRICAATRSGISELLVLEPVADGVIPVTQRKATLAVG